jgi:predicted nucleic-acid-binding protein
MIALDTNVLARYLVRDDARQSALAKSVIEAECSADEPGIISLVALCELVWVLDRGYGYSRADIAAVLRKLLGSSDVRIERAELAWQALNDFERGSADFADYLIGYSGKAEKAAATVTFDRRAASSELFRLLK